MAKVTIEFDKPNLCQSLAVMPVLEPFVIEAKSTGKLIVAFKTPPAGSKSLLIYISSKGFEWDLFDSVKDDYKVVDIKAEVNIQVN